MKLFTIMNGFKTMKLQCTVVCCSALKKSAFAGMFVLLLSAGAVLAQAPTVTISPNYQAEMLTLSCSNNSYNTYYWSTEANITTQDLADEEGVQGSELSVAGMPHGTTVYVWAMHLNGDTPEWSDMASYTIVRYDAPLVTANYTSISNHIFTVNNPSTNGTATVRYAVGAEPTVSSEAVTGGTVAVAQYYTTYNFRVFGDVKFPSENVSKSTNRYNPPVIVDYVHYTAPSGSSPEVPTSGTLYSELGSYVYINSSHGVGGSLDTLAYPVPGDANTYDMVVAPGMMGTPVSTNLRGVFKMVASSNPDDLSSAEMFPSPMVRVDNLYSGYYVVQHSAAEAGETTHHYLSLDNNHQLQNTTTFDYGCLWRLDNENRLYQQIGTTKYYVTSDLNAHTTTTNAERWRIHPISHLLQGVDGNRLSYDGGAWRLSRYSSDMAYYNSYMVNKRHADGGTYDEISRFELSGVKIGGDATEWIALANGDAACSLSVTPQVTVTTYQLPAHDHYSYFDEADNEADFTYYPRTRQSYALHHDLPYQSVAPNGVNNTPNPDNINYVWHLEYDEADGTGLVLGGAAISATGAEATNTIVRDDNIVAPQRARLWVEATYTVTNTSSDGDITYEVRTAISAPLVIYAEQAANVLTALGREGNALEFVSGHFYLLANYSEHQASYGTRHFITAAADNNTPYLSEAATPERLFQITYNSGHGTYDLKNMTLDQMLTATSTTSNYVNDQSAVTYGGMATTDQHEFRIYPYSDGTNTYFTIRPYTLNDGVAASLVPQGGSLQEGATLRLVNSKGSEHVQGTGSDAISTSFSEDYFYTSRWQLVVPTLLPPDIAMDNEGHVTLTDVRPFITGSLHYQIKAVGSTDWSQAAQYVEGSITLQAGDMLRVWKEGIGEHSRLGQSATKEFTAEKVATPTATSSANGNMVTLSTSTPDATLYYTMASEAPTSNPLDDGSTLYSTPFELNHAGTIQCRAYASDMLMSDVLVYGHTAVLPLQIVAENGYATLGMSDNSVTSGYTIYYTTDGSLPTTESILYSDPISLEGVLVLKAKAFPNEENNGYAASPVESYYPNSLMLTFCYLDQDRVEGHTPVAADTNMMLLSTSNNRIAYNDHDIDATFLWRCSNDITSNASKLFNEATASYLTFDANGGVYGTTDINDAKEWLWTGEPNASNLTNSGKYYLTTTVGEDVYYLVFNKTTDNWTVTNTIDNDLEQAVAYRTDLVAYPGGHEFSVDGTNLFLEFADGSRAELADQPWLALSQGESATLRASLKGRLITYVANTDINIHKYVYDDHAHAENDYDNYVPWQQWHQLGEDFYHYYYDVPGYVATYQADRVDPNTTITWQFGATALTANNTETALDGTYFTYQMNDATPDAITVTRTTATDATPMLTLDRLTISYGHSSVYANGGVPFAETLPLSLYAEKKESNIGSLTPVKRLANMHTHGYLAADPTLSVVADASHPYLAGEPMVVTAEQYTKYAMWQVSSQSGSYNLNNSVYARGAYYRSDNEGGLYLCNPQSDAMFNYTHAEHTNPLTDGSMQGGYSLNRYANGNGQYYVTLAQGSRTGYGLDANGVWQTVGYGNDGVNGYLSRRWKWEDAPLTPPDISMNPSGVVSLSHLQAGTEGLTYYYTTDGDDPSTSSNVWNPAEPVTLSEGQTIKTIAVLTGTQSEVNSFTAVRCAEPQMNGTTLTATEGDSLVLGVNQELETVHWNTEGAEGIVRYNQSSVRHSEYGAFFRDGDVMEVVAYRHNMLESEPYYYTQNQHLNLAVESVTVGEVGADNTYSATITFSVTGSAQNGQNPQPQSYQIHYSYGSVGGSPSAEATFDGLTLTLNGLSGAQMLTARVEPREDFVDFYTQSEQLNQYIVPAGYTGTLTQDANNVYLINNALDLVTVANTPAMWGSNYHFKVTADIDLTGINLPSIGSLTSPNPTDIQPNAFQGHWNGNYKTISHTSKPLFAACSNAHVYNVVIANSEIITSESGAWGAICATACGSTRIYNSGLRGTSTVSGSGRTGGLVGLLHGNSRVVNCYNFASVSSSNSNVGGIVGYQNSASTRTDINCLIFNCMNYGEITTSSSQSVSPVAAGNTTKSSSDGFNTYNYFLLDVHSIAALTNINYNGALAVEKDFLTRYEFYRLILNSNRKKCGRWVNADAYTAGAFTDEVVADEETIGTWVLDTTIAPYPVVLPKYEIEGTNRIVKKYPSIINPDYDNAARRDTLQSYQGKKLGALSVMVNGGDYFTGSNSWALNITDMDTTAHDYTYGKVQLPYFQDVFGVGNNVQTVSNQDYIVTGWDIISVTKNGTAYTTSSVTNYNYADRNNPQKDIYDSNNKRVFAQGGYYIVPEGVESITIRAHWGRAIYLSESSNESAYQDDNITVANLSTLYGTCAKTLYGTVKTAQTTITDAMNQLSNVPTVYDQAVVLLSDFHVNSANSVFFNSSNKQYPLTIMSVDEDNDHEPDHCLFQSYMGRKAINPVRFDMIVHAGFNMAGLPSGKKPRDLTICLMRGHFEITETALAHYSQFEYDQRGDNDGFKTLAPLILNGGVFDQIISGENKPTYNCDRTEYIQLGGHVWFKMFSPGAHGNNSTAGKKTKHCPVTVTGGEYKSFYLSGMFRPDVTPFDDDNPCLYASGGRFGHYASGGHDKIGGNVTVEADHIIADEFYGGGINPTNFGNTSNPSYSIGGNIKITLNNSLVGLYAAGPKFGGMNQGKTVVTYAEGTTFGTYYGAGYGGTGLKFYFAEEMNSAFTYSDNFIKNNYNNQRGKYQTGNSAIGITIDYDFDFMQRSASDATHTVRRIYTYRAELSNAPTNEVTSTLKNCHVKGNYYGAGYVGRVNGKALSTLENCIIDSNVFAGGNSSTAPKAKVYPPIDLTKKPELITTTYYIPTKPNPTEYTWTTDASRSYSNGVVELEETSDGRFLIYTSKDLNTMGMGQADETELTITGNTVVMGSVFGGGNLAEVAGNTTLNVGEETIAAGEDIADHRPYIHRNVYGGGNVADVGTNTGFSTTTVNVYQGYMRSVYGGGNQGSIGGNTLVNMKGGFVGYAPAEQTVEPTGTETESTVVTAPTPIRPSIGRDKLFFGVYGGGFGVGTTVEGSATVNVGDATAMTDSIKVFGSVYGGGEAGQVGGGYHRVALKENEVLTANHYYFDKSQEVPRYVRCVAGEDRVADREYYTFVQPTFGENSGTSVRVQTDGTMKTEIDGAVYGGGRGYYMALENDTVAMGVEVNFVRPTAGAVYGNTKVEIGTLSASSSNTSNENVDMYAATEKLTIGSIRFFTPLDKADEYGLIDKDSITASPMGYWRQNLYVYDVDKLRYVPLTTGEDVAIDCNAATMTGSKIVNTSAETLDDEVRYYMPTGRVSVAGGGENGRVFGSLASANNVLFDNTAENPYITNSRGCTEVTIHSGRMGDMDDIDRVVSGDVYGAGLQADIDGTSSVTIDGTSANTWIRGDVYAGGCMGTNHAYNRASEDVDIDVTTATVTGGWLRNLHAASNLVELPKNGNSHMVFGTTDGNDDDLLVSESIYGGSGLSYMQGTTDVTVNSGHVGFIRQGYHINSEGEDLPLSTELNDPIIPNVDHVLSYEGNVYGGGYGPNAYVKKTKVTVNGGVIRNGVFGGGELAPVGEITEEAGVNIATYEYLTYDKSNGNDMTVATHYVKPAVEPGSQATMGIATDVVVNGGQMSGVYGGGRGYSSFLNVESTKPGTIMGSTSVYIGGGTIDSTNYQAALGGGNVYGGGLEGEVTGDTRVTIAGGEIVGRVFAGGRGYGDNMLRMLDEDEDIFDRASRRAGWVMGNTVLTVKDSNSIQPIVHYGVYGGGEGLKYKTVVRGTNKWDVVAVVDGNTTVNIEGGNIGGGFTHADDPERGSYAGGRVASVNGYADMLVSGSANVASVYGGNDISGKIECLENRSTQNVISNTLTTDSTYTYVLITGTPQVGNVFGGGNGQYPYYNDVAYTSRLYLEKPEQTKTYVDINTQGGRIGQVFGGGNSAMVGTAQVFYRGTGYVDYLFAGGNSETVTDAASVTVRASSMTPANDSPVHVNYLFGGNNMATMTILPSLNLTQGVLGNVYGGGNMGAMMGNGSREDVFGNTVDGLSSYVLVNSNNVTVTGSLFGGCNNAAVGGKTYVDVRKTSTTGINMLFGGNDISEHVSKARVDVSGGTITKMFGGSNGYYDYRRNGNSWDVYEKSSELANSQSSTLNSQSENQPLAINTVGSPTVGATQVNIWGGTINNNIYGGGYAGDCGTTHVVVNDTAHWDESNAANDPLGRTNGGNATINGKIFGGGYGDIASLGTATPHVGNVTECATTDLYNVTTLRDAYAYGGGEAGDVQDAVLNVHEGWNQPLTALYGGCYGSDVKGTATVNMYCLEPPSGYNVTTLYGGNDYTGTVNRSVVNIYGGRYDRLFGAGNGKYVYTGDITPPNSQYPTVNFYNGTMVGNLYGGGEQGTCFVGDYRVRHLEADDYAHVVVNIHGGTFMKDVFAGAVGDENNPQQLVYGLKQLNMDGGEVYNSIYGGSESVGDGYAHVECTTGNTTKRPSSILNLTGGTVHNNVYGGGYLGQVHGSVYVNVGRDAVDKSPVWTNNYNGTSNAYQHHKPTLVEGDAPTGNELTMRNLYLGASIYNGANWGEAGTNVYFNTPGFFGGESRIYVDGYGYNTSGSDNGSSMPEMDIYYSLIGAGTSCEGGDVERHILVRNYGERNGCETSKTLFSIQRADTVRLQNTAIKLIGDQDAMSAYPSNRYSVNRVKSLRLQDYNVLEIDEPIARTEELLFLTGDDGNGQGRLLTANNTTELAAMRPVNPGACDADRCTLLASAVNPTDRRYSAILVNNGVAIDIANENGGYGPVQGYGFLLSESGYKAVASARAKTTNTNQTDGGFFSCCNENNYIDNGAYNGGEFEFVNNVTSNPTYRTWKAGTPNVPEHTKRKVTIVAHSNIDPNLNNKPFTTDLTDNDEQVLFGLAKGTIELPSTVDGHYYAIQNGVYTGQNSEMILTTGAYKPTNFAEATDVVSGSWETIPGTTANSTEVQSQINGDPSRKFGLLMTGGGNFQADNNGISTTAVISANEYYAQSGSYRTTAVTTGDASEVVPKLDFYLAYSPNFATTTFGEVTFTLTEYAPSSDPSNPDPVVVGYVDINVTITTIIDEFRDQKYDVVAMHNDFGQNEYTRKLVLPASMQRRHLYLTSVKWKPEDNRISVSGKTYEPSGVQGGNTMFNLTNGTTGTLDPTHFGLKLEPTEHISQTLTTTLGWYSIDTPVLDIYDQSGKTEPSSAYSGSNSDSEIAVGGANLSELSALDSDPTYEYSGSRGQFVGVLDGRSSAAIDLSLMFNGSAIYEEPRRTCRGEVVMRFDYWNGNTHQGHFDVTVYVRVRQNGDTIYLASAESLSRTVDGTTYTLTHCDNTENTDRGKMPSLYIQSLSSAFLDGIYEAGDVLCILDQLDITDNQSLRGLDYNYIPVVRYEGHHHEFPGRKCAYRGSMINVGANGILSTDNVIFDGSMVSRYQSEPYNHPVDTLWADAPIFEVSNGGMLNLGNNTMVQNNYNASTGGTLGGAIHVGSGGLLRLENSVTIENNLVAANVGTGAVHVDGGTMLLSVAKKGTEVHIEHNYHLPTNNTFIDDNKVSIPDGLAKGNVYLTRTSVDGSDIADAQSDMILFESELAANSRIGISKDFPGPLTRDTIRIAQVSGSHLQFAQRAYNNENFFNDGADGKVFFNSTISTKTLYFQRCATFRKQLYADGQNPLNYIVLHDGVPSVLQNGYQQPVLTYQWNQYAACPDETDSLIYQVHGGFYPYTYNWQWGTSADNLSSYREYTTPYTHDAINADLAQNNFVKATESNRDAGELHGMLLSGGSGGDFFYRVTASDLAGCQLTKNVKVTMTHQDSPAGIALTSHIDGNDYAWNDTAGSVLHLAHRNFRGIHLVAQVVPDPAWGNVAGYLSANASTPDVALTDMGTLLCPGDAVRLTALPSDDNHRFIQWDFDPYDRNTTVFVMPHVVNDVHINAYFGPKDYWKNVVTSKPESVTYDYNGDVHVYDADGLAWLISLTNGLNGQQIRDFYFNTVYIHNPNASPSSKEGQSTAAAYNYDMKAHLWTPMGNAQHRFMGKLRVDDGVTISGIIVDEPRMDHAGFFAYLDSADIDGLHIQKSLFHGSQYVGGIAAEAVNSTLTHSSVADTGVVGDNPDITTIITANYASGGLVGTAKGSTISNCNAAARYMGATIYNGGILGLGQDVDVSNSFVMSRPRMSSLYSSGIVGSITGTDEGSKSHGGSRIANNYVHFVGPDTPLGRVGGLVGFARNVTLENNYVYGSTQGGTLTGALGAMIDRGVTVSNCYYEQGSNEAPFGFSGAGNHTTGVTTFNGRGNQVMMADRVDGTTNLTLALNRWVRHHADEGFTTWRSDLEGTNNGYPHFGQPDMVPIYENISYVTCDSITLEGETLTESGVYEFHLVDSADFVDSTVILTLTVNHSSLTQLEDTVLLGEDYEAYGFHLSATEIQLLRQAAQQDDVVTVVVSDTLQTVHSCDSIVTLYLTVNKPGSDQPPAVLDVNVYPNPTVAWVTVEADEMQQIELYDGVSRCIHRRVVSTNSSKLNLTNLPTGIYYLRVKTANGTVIKKLIKE